MKTCHIRPNGVEPLLLKPRGIPYHALMLTARWAESMPINCSFTCQRAESSTESQRVVLVSPVTCSSWSKGTVPSEFFMTVVQHTTRNTPIIILSLRYKYADVLGAFGVGLVRNSKIKKNTVWISFCDIGLRCLQRAVIKIHINPLVLISV